MNNLKFQLPTHAVTFLLIATFCDTSSSAAAFYILFQRTSMSGMGNGKAGNGRKLWANLFRNSCRLPYRVGVGQNSIKSTWDKSMKLWRVFSTPGQNTPRVVVEYYVPPQLISPINLSASHGATFVDRSLAMKPVNFSSWEPLPSPLGDNGHVLVCLLFIVGCSR